MHKPNNTKTR